MDLNIWKGIDHFKQKYTRIFLHEKTLVATCPAKCLSTHDKQFVIIMLYLDASSASGFQSCRLYIVL